MLAVLLAAFMQTAAAAPATPSGTITNPDWQRRPTGEEIGRHFPKAATEADLAGRVVLVCTVTAEGTLTECSPDAVDPTGVGFGEAAVAMSEAFRMRPQTLDGKPVAGGTVRIPIRFLIPANLRTGPVRARHPEVVNQIVELDCRYRELKLDNCFVRAGATEKAAEVALKVAEQITLPGLPTQRKQGRIVLPLVFTDASGVFAPPAYITQPRWRERATPSEVFRAFPEAARRDGTVGSAVIDCEIDPGKRLKDCKIFEEAPTGLGFGEAALGLMPKFELDEVDMYGLKVVGRRIRVPVRMSPVAPPAR